MLEGLAGNKLKTLATACLDVIRLIWHDLEENGMPADKFLSEYFRANHKYGSRDRHAITSSVFAFFRWKGCLEKLFDIDPDNLPGPALSAALAGRRFPGWKLVEGKSVRKFTDDACVAARVEAAGIDPYEKKMLGLTAL